MDQTAKITKPGTKGHWFTGSRPPPCFTAPLTFNKNLSSSFIFPFTTDLLFAPRLPQKFFFLNLTLIRPPNSSHCLNRLIPLYQVDKITSLLTRYGFMYPCSLNRNCSIMPITGYRHHFSFSHQVITPRLWYQVTWLSYLHGRQVRIPVIVNQVCIIIVCWSLRVVCQNKFKFRRIYFHIYVRFKYGNRH